VRLFLFKALYRKSVEFSIDRLEEAKSAYERILNVLKGEVSTQIDEKLYESFKIELFDDFNTPGAISYIFDAVSGINAGENEAVLRATVNRMLSDLGFVEESVSVSSNNISDELIDIIVEIRNKAKNAKNFDLSDQIRNTLKEKGITISDTKEGAVWKRED